MNSFYCLETNGFGFDADHVAQSTLCLVSSVDDENGFSYTIPRSFGSLVFADIPEPSKDIIGIFNPLRTSAMVSRISRLLVSTSQYVIQAAIKMQSDGDPRNAGTLELANLIDSDREIFGECYHVHEVRILPKPRKSRKRKRRGGGVDDGFDKSSVIQSNLGLQSYQSTNEDYTIPRVFGAVAMFQTSGENPIVTEVWAPESVEEFFTNLRQHLISVDVLAGDYPVETFVFNNDSGFPVDGESFTDSLNAVEDFFGASVLATFRIMPK
jgi:hypothetical protein